MLLAAIFYLARDIGNDERTMGERWRSQYISFLMPNLPGVVQKICIKPRVFTEYSMRARQPLKTPT